MSVRPHLFVSSRAFLLEVLETPVAVLAERVGARVVEHPPGAFETFDYVVPGKDWDFLVDVVDPAASVRAHLAREAGDVRALLECLAAWSHEKRVVHIPCHRRWWVGSVAAALRDVDRFDAEACAVLAGLTGTYDVGDPDVDAAGRDLVLPDRVLPPSRGSFLWIGEMPVARLAGVLARVADRREWGPPRGPYGLGPARDDLSGWSEWVGELVERILLVASERPDDWLVSCVA